MNKGIIRIHYKTKTYFEENNNDHKTICADVLNVLSSLVKREYALGTHAQNLSKLDQTTLGYPLLKSAFQEGISELFWLDHAHKTMSWTNVGQVIGTHYR